VSGLAAAVASPVSEAPAFQPQAAVELATADDLASGLAEVAALVRGRSGARRVEWWLRDDDGVLGLAASAGDGDEPSESLSLGRAGVVLVFGGHLDAQLESALASLESIVRRRAAEERLARETIRLARENEALEDFAALVAHELKTPLRAALLADDVSNFVEQALDLVDELLEAAQGEGRDPTCASATACFEQTVAHLDAADVEITADLPPALPLPAGALQVILRNLLANSIAAGARHIHVAAVESSRSWHLHVDDDGVGLDAVGSYTSGSGLGLALCRRIAARFGGALDLAARPFGGTRATLVLSEAS
jgi:signal transduction histidine kinase